MPDVFKTAEILVSHAVRVHKDEIAIIAYYGSHAKGLASETSDLDIFYIPDDGDVDSLCTQFVLDGLPYDFWPVSWGLAEDIANARRSWGVAASLIADARVLYHRSQSDLDRFNGLKKRIEELMSPDERKTMVERALEEFKDTLFQLGQVRLAISTGDTEGMRWACLKFVNIAINCLALINQRYFSKGWGDNMAEVLELPQKPDGLEDTVKGIIMPLTRTACSIWPTP